MAVGAFVFANTVVAKKKVAIVIDECFMFFV
jgi:hypothetical protein